MTTSRTAGPYLGQECELGPAPTDTESCSRFQVLLAEQTDPASDAVFAVAVVQEKRVLLILTARYDSDASMCSSFSSILSSTTVATAVACWLAAAVVLLRRVLFARAAAPPAGLNTHDCCKVACELLVAPNNACVKTPAISWLGRDTAQCYLGPWSGTKLHEKSQMI